VQLLNPKNFFLFDYQRHKERSKEKPTGKIFIIRGKVNKVVVTYLIRIYGMKQSGFIDALSF
jgi:hypothetical protein